MDPQDRQRQASGVEDARGGATQTGDEGRGQKMDVREANENIREAQEEDSTDTPVDQRKTGNRPRFDRDR